MGQRSHSTTASWRCPRLQRFSHPNRTQERYGQGAKPQGGQAKGQEKAKVKLLKGQKAMAYKQHLNNHPRDSPFHNFQ
eukprot:5296002-Karenia_brevis.AAC.1